MCYLHCVSIIIIWGKIPYCGSFTSKSLYVFFRNPDNEKTMLNIKIYHHDTVYDVLNIPNLSAADIF